MELIKQEVELLNKQDYESVVRLVEQSGRTCYQSKRSDTLEGAEKFIQNLINAGHESVVEHLNITLVLTTSRNITHQIVRHRLASYSQMSTRYVNQTKNGLQVIDPELDEQGMHEFKKSVEFAERQYNTFKDMGYRNDLAREVLPGSIATELVMTMNVRELRHFLRVRCDKASHYQIRELAKMILEEVYSAYPCFFEDIYESVIIGETE